MTPQVKPPRNTQRDPSQSPTGDSSPKVSILYLEANRADIGIIQDAIGAEGDFACCLHCVSTRDEFLDALKQNAWDVILCDWQSDSLPGEEALALSLSILPQTPIIIVTDDHGEEKAVVTLKTGATDYILKGHPRRLVPAIKRALQDVSERKEQRQSKEKYRTIVQTAQEGIVIADPGGAYTFVNQRMADMLGYGVHEILGKSSSDFADQEWQNTVREARAGLHAGKGVEGEFKFRRKDGSALWTRYNASPMFDEQGKHVANFAMHTDITDHKKAEELIEHVARFPEENPHPILRISPQGELLYANLSSTLILKTWNCVVGQKVPLSWQQVVKDAFSTGKTSVQDVEFDGRTYAFTIVPIAGGPYVNLYGRDITERKQMEAELHKSERERSELLESIQDPFYGLDSEWRYTYVNTKAAKFMAKSPEEVLGKSVWEVFPQVRGTESGRQLLRAMTERVAVHYEVRATVNDIWVEVHIFPKTDGGLSVLYRDIARRKEMEEQIRRQKEEIESLFKIAPVAIFVAHDPEATLITGNPAAYRLVGMSETDNSNMSKSAPEGERPGYQVFREGKEVPAEQLPMRRAILTATEIYDDSLELRLADGSSRHILAYATPLFRTDGAVRGAIGSMVDISALKRAESALKESEERFRIMADTTPVPIWVTNSHGEVELVNHAYEEFFGVREAEIKPPSTWKMLIHPEDQEVYTVAFIKSVETRRPFNAEGRVKHCSGAWRWVHSYATPRFSKDGTFLGHVGSSPDITEERRAADALKASELNLRLMVNQATDGMMVVDPAGMIEAVSALGTRLLGYDEGELVGRNVAEFAETFSRLESLLAIEDLRRQAPRPLSTTVRVATRGGGQQWLSVTASLMNLGTNIEKYFVRFQQIDLPSGLTKPPHRRHKG